MFLAAYLTMMAAQFPVDARAGENKLTQLDLKTNSAGLTFDWSDTEETLRGTVTKSPFKVGKPLTFSVTLEALNSEELMIPVTFSFRPMKNLGASTQTVVRAKNEKSWVATFTPVDEGEHRVEIAWRTTHHKVVRGVLDVAPEGMPVWVGWLVGGGSVTLAVVIGLWLLFGRKEPSANSPPPETPAS
jgi:hypothetical protein